MNRIKVVKRANHPLPLEELNTEMKKVSSVIIKRQAVKVVGNWIDEWRASKPKDAGLAFADLFGSTYLPVNR